MADMDVYGTLLKNLQGVTVLETPRVSRETMITTMRELTLMMRGVKQEMSGMSTMILKLANEAADNRKSIQSLSSDSKKFRTDIESLYKLSAEFRLEMNELSGKVADLYLLKQQFKEQREFIDSLAMKFNVHATEMHEYIATTGHTIALIDKRCSDTQFQLKEMKEYVDRFGDNLVLPSSQIRVETSAGFHNKPLTLLEVLTRCNANFDEQTKSISDHDTRILGNETQILKKADAGVVIQVSTLEKKVEKIEYHLQKEEEQGIGAIRKQCDQLVADVHGMTSELTDKVNKDTVGLIVHEKYEEIVRYLQDALQSSAEDENNFKAKADELQEMFEKLSHSKVDRIEIAPMQEILVKSEALLKKVGAQQKTDKATKDLFTRKEVEALLELKVDKAEFEQQLQLYLKGGIKKTARKLQSMNTNSSAAYSNHVVDEVMVMNDKQGQGQGQGQGGGAQGGATQAGGENAMWKGLADAMKGESDAAVVKAAQMRQQQPAMIMSMSTPSISNNNYNNSATAAPQSTTSEFSAYVKSKKAQVANASSAQAYAAAGVTSSASNPRMSRTPSGPGDLINPDLPVTPGGHLSRVQSPYGYGAGVGQLGGPSYASPGSSTISNLDPGQGVYPFVPPDVQAASGAQSSANNLSLAGQQQQQQQDMAFIGSAVVGCGFNLKAGHISSSQPLKPMNTVDSSVDIEGTGLMLKGHDGKLYYTDTDHMTDSPTRAAPTSKQIFPQKRNNNYIN